MRVFRRIKRADSELSFRIESPFFIIQITVAVLLRERWLTAANAEKLQICLCDKYAFCFRAFYSLRLFPAWGDAVYQRTHFSSDEKWVLVYVMPFGRGHTGVMFSPYFRHHRFYMLLFSGACRLYGGESCGCLFLKGKIPFALLSLMKRLQGRKIKPENRTNNNKCVGDD